MDLEHVTQRLEGVGGARKAGAGHGCSTPLFTAGAHGKPTEGKAGLAALWIGNCGAKMRGHREWGVREEGVTQEGEDPGRGT